MAAMTGRSSGSMSPMMKFFFMRIFPWPFMLVGTLALFFGIRGVLRGHASTAWPAIPGVVQQSSVEYQSSSKGGTYHARVLYTYVLEGATHSGSRVTYGDYGSSDPSHAQGIVNRYPAGKAVTVHYMPDDPDESVLEPGTNFGTWIVPLIGFAFATVGILTFVFLPRLMAKAV
jgi:Protein of unknown function (DUF3592)